MTREELYEVRNIREEISALETKLHELIYRAENLTSIIDGMPKSKSFRSKVERLALEMIDARVELKALETKLPAAQNQLVKKIEAATQDYQTRCAIILRYVKNLSCKEISQLMKLSQRQLFRLQKKFLRGLVSVGKV